MHDPVGVQEGEAPGNVQGDALAEPRHALAIRPHLPADAVFLLSVLLHPQYESLLYHQQGSP